MNMNASTWGVIGFAILGFMFPWVFMVLLIGAILFIPFLELYKLITGKIYSKEILGLWMHVIFIILSIIFITKAI